MRGMFGGCRELEYLDLSSFNTSKVIDMSIMFLECHKLKQIQGINNFNTSNVITMFALFHQCRELENLDLSYFNTSKVTDLKQMFDECYRLKQIKGINNFNTMNNTNMYGMFGDCRELEYLDLSNFITDKVTDMSWVFDGCYKLKQIKGINNFNTINVTSMRGMFKECKELEYLDLSNFNISKVTDMAMMFKKCHKLKRINGINKFNITNISLKKEEMFNECDELEVANLNTFNFPTIKSNNNRKLENQLLEEKNKNLKLLEQLNDEKKKVETIFEQIIAIHFQSIDQRVNFPVPCMLSDNFSKLEEKLYLNFSDLKYKNIYFIANGNKLNRDLTLEQNGIKNGDHILIYYN